MDGPCLVLAVLVLCPIAARSTTNDRRALVPPSVEVLAALELSGVPRHILLVEDVVTSGGQVVESAAALRALGAVVTDAACVIDREAGGTDALAPAGICFHPPFRMSDLKVAG
jgi:orotate phosphoribosyltransferase